MLLFLYLKLLPLHVRLYIICNNLFFPYGLFVNFSNNGIHMLLNTTRGYTQRKVNTYPLHTSSKAPSVILIPVKCVNRFLMLVFGRSPRETLTIGFFLSIRCGFGSVSLPARLGIVR